jgi:hypothetical protein
MMPTGTLNHSNTRDAVLISETRSKYFSPALAIVATATPPMTEQAIRCQGCGK